MPDSAKLTLRRRGHLIVIDNGESQIAISMSSYTAFRRALKLVAEQWTDIDVSIERVKTPSPEAPALTPLAPHVPGVQTLVAQPSLAQ